MTRAILTAAIALACIASLGALAIALNPESVEIDCATVTADCAPAEVIR